MEKTNYDPRTGIRSTTTSPTTLPTTRTRPRSTSRFSTFRSDDGRVRRGGLENRHGRSSTGNHRGGYHARACEYANYRCGLKTSAIDNTNIENCTGNNPSF